MPLYYFSVQLQNLQIFWTFLLSKFKSRLNTKKKIFWWTDRRSSNWHNMIPINPKRNVLDRRLPKAFSIDKHSRVPRGTNHEMKRFLFSADVRMSTLIDAKPPYKKFANKTCKARASMSSSIQRRVHWDHGAHGEPYDDHLGAAFSLFFPISRRSN